MPVHLRAAQAGDVLNGRPRVFSLARILAFSGGPFDQPVWPDRNLHTDKEKAAEAGLPDIIASGTQSEGMLIGFLISVCGRQWHRSGSLDLRFVKSVLVDETVTPKLRVVEKTAEVDGERITFEAWCENQDGVAAVIGQASCLFVASGTEA